MRTKATYTASDSENPVEISPRKERKFHLTPLGHQAVKWIKQQEAKAANDEFAFFCCGCLRVLSSCSCPMQADKLPMDDLPHITVKKA